MPESPPTKTQDVQKGPVRSRVVHSSPTPSGVKPTKQTLRKKVEETRRESKKKSDDKDVVHTQSPNKIDKYLTTSLKKPQATRQTEVRERSPDLDREGRELPSTVFVYATSDYQERSVLAERRERRRTKKAIVNFKPAPQEPEDGHDDSGEGVSKDRRRKKGKSKTTTLAEGLALMHGFSASNVGPGRLTVRHMNEPSRNALKSRTAEAIVRRIPQRQGISADESCQIYKE